MFKILRKLATIRPRIRNISTEVISYDDPKWFPAELGPIQKSPYGDRLELPRCRIDQYIWLNSKQWQDRTALVCGLTGKNYSFAQLRDKCAAFAVNVQKFGLKCGDTVGICMANSPEFIIAALGIIEAGCVVTTFNPVYTSDEVARQIANSDTKLLICLTENYEVVSRAVQITKKNIKIVCAKIDQSQALPEGTVNFYDWDDVTKVDLNALRVYDSDPNNTAFLPYSSGTTGLSKGVMLSHRNIIADSEMMEMNVEPFTLKTTAEQQEVMLCVLPLFHIYAWTAIFIAKLRLGAKIVTLPSFKPNTFIDAIYNHKVTGLNIVPPLVLFLGQSDLVQAKHLATVRRIQSGAAPLGAKDAAAVLEKAPQTIFTNGYGMTEGSVMLLPPSNKHELASSGYPVVASQAKVVAVDDAEMKALGPNTAGEIFFRGPHIMKGYLNNEKATAETLVGNNWLRSGDIGYYNDQGLFYITDRLKELIKVKGFQVAPAELEEVLRTHPSIAEAAVVPAPHPLSGEVPRAFVVARPNKKIDPEEVLKFMSTKLAKFKIPDSIVTVDAIPKNATGKILRRQVKIQFGL